nr:Tn3 family transposase [Deinococcota bacterium]
TLEKLCFLKDYGVADWDLSAVNPNRLKWLADRGGKAQAQGLRKLQAATRYPILAAFLQQRLYLFTDAVVEMFGERLWDLHNECKRAFQEDRLAATKTINETLSAFKTLGKVLLDEEVDDATVRNVAFEKLSPSELETALQRAEQLIRPEQDAYVDYFSTRHRSVQNFSKPFLNTLEFRIGGKDQGLLRALGLIDDIHQGRRRKLPVDAPTAFLPTTWRDEVMSEEGLNWRSYEIAALWVLRERLRSGDVYVTHSRRFRELESYLIPKAAWEAQRAEVVDLTGTPLLATSRLEDKAQELEKVAQRVERLLAAEGSNVRVEAGELILTPHKAADDTPELVWLRQQLDQRLPRRDITNVLIDVDNASGFSEGLTHLAGPQRRDKELLLHLYGSLLAQACNLGFRQMAVSADLLYRRLLWCNRWYIREDSLAEVTAILVEYLMKLPYSEVWGSGILSSSDGQRFPVKGSTRKARAQPNYFGYGKGVTFYTWALDLFAQFGSKAIPSTLRDATFVLDAILNNLVELEVLEHTTDTAGYTEVVFALFDLLGMTFSPRLRDLADQQLYRLPGLDLAELPKLKAHLSGIISEDQIRSGWDEMLRLILSLKKGYVTSSLIVQKLQAYPRKHPLMRVLQEYGRLVKTLHILNWYDDLGLRRRVSQQLNKGEALHRLRSAIFYGRHGQLDSMEDEPLDQVVGCLNVVSNIVIVWNTIHMAKVVDELKAEGNKISDETLAKVWPTRFGHLNIVGRYHFAAEEIRMANA